MVGKGVQTLPCCKIPCLNPSIVTACYDLGLVLLSAYAGDCVGVPSEGVDFSS